MFEKPLGMRDTLPLLYETKMKVRNRMLQEMTSWGYQMIATPALEYYETVGKESAIQDQQLFTLIDQQGHTLVLRPDMTAPIARVAASKLLKYRIPVRLAYAANVYRAQQNEGGRPAEFEQVGIECIGHSTVSGDAESIALLVSVLRITGLENFKISVGHIGYIQQLFLDVLHNEEKAEQCLKFLYEKNYVGYREHVKKLALSDAQEQRLLKLLSLRGLEEIFMEGSMLLENEAGLQAISELEELHRQLKDFGVYEYVNFDLSLVCHMSYYTGLLFEVYANGVGAPIGSGGRYDNLLSKFNYKAPATGFAVSTDRLLEALGNLEAEKDSYCILFSEEQRQDAIKAAAKMRAEGKVVILQDINGVKDVTAFTSSFTAVEYMTDSEGEEQ